MIIGLSHPGSRHSGGGGGNTDAPSVINCGFWSIGKQN